MKRQRDDEDGQSRFGEFVIYCKVVFLSYIHSRAPTASRSSATAVAIYISRLSWGVGAVEAVAARRRRQVGGGKAVEAGLWWQGGGEVIVARRWWRWWCWWYGGGEAAVGPLKARRVLWRVLSAGGAAIALIAFA